MISKLLDLLNGALGSNESQPLELVEDVYPKDGIIIMPLPPLSEQDEQGEVIELLVKKGDSVRRGEALVVLEFENATVELPSPCTGVITDVYISDSSWVSAGEKLFKIHAASLRENTSSS